MTPPRGKRKIKALPKLYAHLQHPEEELGALSEKRIKQLSKPPKRVKRKRGKRKRKKKYKKVAASPHVVGDAVFLSSSTGEDALTTKRQRNRLRKILGMRSEKCRPRTIKTLPEEVASSVYARKPNELFVPAEQTADNGEELHLDLLRAGATMLGDLRNHLPPVVRAEHGLHAAIQGSIENYRLIPMKYLMEQNHIYACRERMKRAIVDVLEKTLRDAYRSAFQKWRAYSRMREVEFAQATEKHFCAFRRQNGASAIARITRRISGDKMTAYFRHWARLMRRARRKEEEEASVQVQRLCRGHFARNCTRKIRKARRRIIQTMKRKARAVCLLERIELFASKSRFDAAIMRRDRRKAAKSIQAWIRRIWAIARIKELQSKRLLFVEQTKASIVLNAAFRRCIAALCAARLQKLAEVEQNRIFAVCAARYKRALQCQRVVRGHFGREIARHRLVVFQRESDAARRIQKMVRVKNGSYAFYLKCKAREERLKEERRVQRSNAATMMQTVWRIMLAKKLVRIMRQRLYEHSVRQNDAATKLQIFWYRICGKRDMAMRCELRRMQKTMELNSAVSIARVWRGFKGRRKAKARLQRVCASKAIQRSWRCCSAKLKLASLRRRRRQIRWNAAMQVQLSWRCMKARRRYAEHVKVRDARIAELAAIKIQSVVRMYIAIGVKISLRLAEMQRRAMERKRCNAAMLISKVFRGRRGRMLAMKRRRQVKATYLQCALYRRRKARARERSLRKLAARNHAKIRWNVVERNVLARKIQCRFRVKSARTEFRRRKRAARHVAAKIIVRFARMLLARAILRRLKRARAASVIQKAWYHCTGRHHLLLLFAKRRALLDAECAAATKLQSIFRMRKGRKEYSAEASRIQGERYKLQYILERRREIERAKLERNIGEIHAKEQKRVLNEAEIRTRKAILGDREAETRDAIPLWAKKLPKNAVIEKLRLQDDEKRRVANAWVEIEDDATQSVYYYNEITFESSWERPVDMPEDENSRRSDDGIPPWKKLPCSQCVMNIQNAGSQDTSEASIAVKYCAQCKTVLCEACDQDNHLSGSHFNHTRMPIESTDTTVCAVCSSMLAESTCKECKDAFCDVCCAKVHAFGAMAMHKLIPITRYVKPDLKRGENWCAECNLVAATRKCDQCMDYFCDSCFEVLHKRGRRKAHTYTPANEVSTWKMMYDVKSQKNYYYNSFTSESSWEKPPALMTDEEKAEHESKLKNTENANQVLENEVHALEEALKDISGWKEMQLQRQMEEEEAARPKEYANKTLRSAILSNPIGLLRSPKKFMEKYDEEEKRDQKYYLDRMLMNQGKLKRLDGIKETKEKREQDKVIYKKNLLEELSEGRYAARQEQLNFSKNLLTGKAYKNAIDGATQIYDGPYGSKALAKKCKHHGILYGPKVADVPGKLSKTEAIAALVLKEHEIKIQEREEQLEEKLEREREKREKKALVAEKKKRKKEQKRRKKNQR